MKKYIYLLLLPLTVMIVACGGKNKKQGNDIQLVMQDSTDAHGLQRMQISKSEVDIKFKGKDYHSYVSRTPDELLPHVVSEMGDTYIDNRIVLRLTRGKDQIFRKEFTKQDFAPFVDAGFLSKAVLEGMVYDKTTPAGFVYAASVCYPQTDSYVPLSITISADGKKVKIEKEDLLEEVYEDENNQGQ